MANVRNPNCCYCSSGAGTLTTVLDDIIQDASAQIKKTPGQFPPGQTQGGQQQGGQKFYIICNNVDKENRNNWNNIHILEEEGHEIGSHSMNHNKLSKLSEDEMEYEIIESKRCLQANGFDVTSFSFPYKIYTVFSL